MKTLTESDKRRYARNILLGEIGEAGQAILLNAKVLIVGLGGLGSPIAYYLASSGIGTLGLADGDTVDISNLQRQIIHGMSDVGKLKVASASEKLLKINPELALRCYDQFMNEETLRDTAADYDFIIDATDSLAMKQVINRVCVGLNKPFSHGGIHQFSGEAMTVIPHRSACYYCAYPFDAQDTAAGAPPRGPLGPVAGIVGCIQATECLKYLLGMKDLLTNTLLIVETVSMAFERVAVRSRSNCPVCGTGVEIALPPLLNRL